MWKPPSYFLHSTFLVVIAVGLIILGFWRDHFVNKQVEKLSVYMPVMAKLPDPADIKNTGQWYVLGHVSSGLAHFDHVKGKFEPLLADYEAYSSGVHSFTLKEDAKFSDGTAITALDVVASIKRLVIRKTSTHFPLWAYLEGCENLRAIADECSGLKAVSSRRIEIRLKRSVESFLLQMSSPETGIWCAGDIDPKTLDLKPSKFSGPYQIDRIDETGFLLIRNSENPISKLFPHSPKSIRIHSMKSDSVNDELARGGLDIAIRSHNPYDSVTPEKLGMDVFRSAPATLLYLHATGKEAKHLISREYLESLWNFNTDTGITPSDNFLPFDPGLSISRTEFLNELPERSKIEKRTVRVGVPWTYLSKGFYEFLSRSGKDAGIAMKIIELTREEWLKALDDGSAPQSVDFVLSVYAVSERYPAVQLRYITGKVRAPEIDLTQAESPDLSSEKREILRDYQKELLRKQYAVPLFMARHQIMYRNTLSVGDQPPSDAEVELWRVVRR